jgi:hypothetical protein
VRTLYLRKEDGDHIRKVLIDMAYLVSHIQIRLPRVYFEEGLYLPYTNNGQLEKYFLTRDKIIKEEEYHYFFNFPFSPEQVENSAD